MDIKHCELDPLYLLSHRKRYRGHGSVIGSHERVISDNFLSVTFKGRFDNRKLFSMNTIETNKVK